MADDYDDDNDERRSPPGDATGGIPVGGKLALAVAALTVLPGAIATTGACFLAVERRRIRGRWWVLWAAITAAIGLVVSGSLAAWASQPLRLPAWLLTDLAGLSIADTLSDLGPTLTATAETSLAAALLGQLLFGLPVGFAITAIYTRVRRFKREKLGEIEGPEFSNWRPVGHLDRLRARRTADQIRAGHYTFAPESEKNA